MPNVCCAVCALYSADGAHVKEREREIVRTHTCPLRSSTALNAEVLPVEMAQHKGDCT
jgi:hypothetical protein